MSIAPRRITYVAISNNIPNSVVTAAETFGELKREFPEVGAAAQGMKAFIRDTNTDVTSDGQFLPVGDFTLYFLVEKNKSGINEVEAVINQYLDTVLVPLLQSVK